MDQIAKLSLMVALGAAQKGVQSALGHVHDETLKNTLTTLQTALTGAITAVAMS